MDRQPLILLHGALGSAAQFNALKAELYSSQFDVHTLNFSGHGGKPFSRFSMDHFVRELGFYIGQKQLKDVSVLGYSMGGYVALEAARQAPQLFGTIVTLATKFDWSPETAALEVQRLLPEQIEAKVPRFAEVLAKRHAPTNWKMVVRKTALMLMDLGEHPPLTPENLRTIDLPVWVCRGTQDKMVTEEESRLTAERLPRGEYVSLPEVPHPLEKVPTEQLRELIDRFLG